MSELMIVGGVLVLYMSALFVTSLIRNDNGTADIGYGGGFMVATATAFLLTSPTSTSLVFVALVFVWGTRLALRIYRKNRGKPEDFRYRAWREAWGKTFVARSFLQIYMLQGAVIFLVSLPVLLSILFPASTNTVVFIIGIALWCIGFFFEVVGDAQLDRFLAQSQNKGRIMHSGLWRYSRHPNYFGESTMWWGIAIAAAGVSVYPLIGFISPLLITFLLLKVSGVPMLEKRWEGNPEWEAYKAHTSVFFPLPPKQ